jgi:hypothetical protein
MIRPAALHPLAMSKASSVIDILQQLSQGLPAITPALGETLAEAITICLTSQNHPNGIILSIEGDFQTQICLSYPPVTAQMQRCWNDQEYTTEQAAYGIAILLIRHLTNLTVIERSRKGSGFDYWLGMAQPNLPFQRLMRLEVSGIRQGNDRLIKTRVRIKKEQVRRVENDCPAYVAIIEFGTPCAHISQA